jgi:hypothetical protein
LAYRSPPGFLTDVVQQVVDAQDKLVDLSKSTAISDRDPGRSRCSPQRLTGGDLDSLAASINKLQVNIGKDPEKYKQLGIDAQKRLRGVQTARRHLRRHRRS